MQPLRILMLLIAVSFGFAGCGGGTSIETGMPSDVQGPAPDVDMGQPPVFDMKGTRGGNTAGL